MDINQVIAQLVAATSSREYVIVVGAVIYLLVYAAKQPAFASVFNRIPLQYRAYAVAALGVLAAVATSILAGQPIVSALLGGLLSACAAIGTDQMVTAKPSDVVELPPPSDQVH